MFLGAAALAITGKPLNFGRKSFAGGLVFF
jgi:hypothetical protein